MTTDVTSADELQPAVQQEHPRVCLDRCLTNSGQRWVTQPLRQTQAQMLTRSSECVVQHPKCVYKHRFQIEFDHHCTTRIAQQNDAHKKQII